MPENLAARWRARAEDVRRFAPAAAEAFLEVARDFEEWLRDQVLEPLSLHEAALESGYSVRHLRRMIRAGILPNVGTDDEPAVLRRDLPRKPGHHVPGLAEVREGGPSSKVQVARAIARAGG